MRIDLLAIGSRGDVQPFVALGLGLQRAGHRVRIVTLGRFEDVVRPYGLDHVSVGDSPQDIAATASGKCWVEQRDSVVGFLRGFVRVAGALVEDGMAAYWRVCQDAEALVTSAGGLLLAVNVAEKLGLPLIRAQYAPSVPTRYDWNGRTSRAIALRGAWEALAAATFLLFVWQGLRRPTNRARRDLLGLPPLPLHEPFAALNRRRIPLLDGYSPAVVARPPDWGEWVHVTGYWFLDPPSQWLPPPGLVDFLRSGPPPVFVGFGSTPFPNPDATTELVVRALARAGRRGIVVAGKSGLATGRLADDILSIDSVPHDWLLPQVSAAVHHGGAGVTGAVLRAGLPSVVVPIFGDQPFWAKRVFALGAGPRPIPARRLTDGALASAIRTTADADMRRRAAALGAKIRAEDGVACGVEVIQRHLLV
jgi:UDP:flavonoid glycosyltransferase YjiC (YdhE family)